MFHEVENMNLDPLIPYDVSARDKVSLDIFWLRDELPEDSDNLPAPEILAAEIVDDLEAELEQYRELAGDLNSTSALVHE